MRAALNKGAEIIIWRFTDGKAGHDAQSQGLINALSNYLDCRIYEIPPCSLRHCLSNLIHCRFPAGDLMPDPVFLIGAGHSTHAGMLCARHARGGKNIVLMRPSLPIRWFDLCLIPDHDPPSKHKNVLRTRGPLNSLQASQAADPGHGLILLGGTSHHFLWDESDLLQQVVTLSASGGRWTLVDSRRTPESTSKALNNLVSEKIAYIPWTSTGPGWLAEKFQKCGTVWVTPDSMSMIHEALTAGAAVGLFRLAPRGENRLSRAIRRLCSEHLVTAYDDWLQGQTLGTAASRPLNEADRCARMIIDKFRLGAVAEPFLDC
ncbi:MAG: hypothetical protein A3I78_01450 [Gammaproteobacteria bacterium RIFCSPLOWO2_02_FULL_56_15]|nr:MAG: hypothetical protein A3I78_01450 [Gammaproteobacteria bacterium RIFCSPLOWO2_02_FULL_56_15]